jgi:hypothetical protein
VRLLPTAHDGRRPTGRHLSSSEAALDIAQIAANLLGAGQLVAGRLVMSAGAASRAGAAWTGTMARVADWSQKAYVPLTVARSGADVVTVALAIPELAKQLEAIEKSGADEGERTRLKALLLSQFAVTTGLVALSIKGDLPAIKGGKSLYVYVPRRAPASRGALRSRSTSSSWRPSPARPPTTSARRSISR